MEKRTIGAFLSALRRANGMTQQEVADKLNVSNKTVSKWERDEGCPEIMMLPALAELYSVSVDEILRGERIIKDESEQKKNEKSEERLKYLAERASVKFTNCSIVSVVLGALAFVLSYSVGAFVSYDYLQIAWVLILVLIAASVSVLLVAFNNFLSVFRSVVESHRDEAETAMNNCIKYITVVTFLTVVSLLGLIICIIVGWQEFIFVTLPVTVMASAVVACYVRSLLYKKYQIEEKGLSPAQRLYRRKHIKVTAIVIAIVVAVSFLLPFACGIVESSSHPIYSFPEGVGYQYETDEQAEREYYKLKGYVTGEKTLYKIISEEYSEEAQEYILYVEPLQEYFEQVKGRFNKVATEPEDEEALHFKSFGEVEHFKQENAFDDQLEYIADQRNIIFDDETLSVSYQTQNYNFFSGVVDIMPIFLLLGSGGIAIVLVVSVIIYFKNKNRIA